MVFAHDTETALLTAAALVNTAARDLDWRMRHTLREMVSSAWEARQLAG